MMKSVAHARLVVLGVLLSLIGSGLSIYSTIHHREVKLSGNSDFACNINDQFSCDDIARSEYSEVLNIPLGVWGLGFFVCMAFILVLGYTMPQNTRDSLQAFAAISLIGVLISLTLGILSTVVIGKYCIVCMGMYACALGYLILVATHWKVLPRPFTVKSVSNGATAAMLAVAVIVVAYQFLWPAQPKPLTPDSPEMQEILRQQQANSTPRRNITINRNQYSGFGEDFRKGPDAAKVVIVEFADFECPACGMAASALHKIYSEFPDQVQVVFKNYPLDISCNSSMRNRMHENACTVAKLARCAGGIGKFWQYHDAAFRNQRQMSKELALQIANEVGLNAASAQRCLESKDIQDKIADDISLANQFGVTGTPAIFINGHQYHGGLQEETLRQVVINALK